ncbi:non-hydrolyzing UDP-N-acetylglucosamine 2-epimerase [Kibdelosporangium philippinense]|uniref:non-hydrolyzing UDP-N-acetylglucosamine 2-epimerase n=1 Tax=Kibdelosporangium philippinense TaxID=211113 RepID=UPI0024C27A18|nr:UDP-N-acetylglucosamine 2-epimerase (non-hydrolyzing) [Kibdelosporangium philippinense]
MENPRPVTAAATHKPEVMLLGGTRPEAVKLAPVAEAMLTCGRIRPVLVASGQHETMFEQALDAFGIRPDVRLNIERSTGSQPELLGELVRVLDRQLIQRNPSMVVVQGDTTTALAGALSAFWRKVPVAHIEAGLRSRDLHAPFPEEANRKLIAQISSLHLAPTKRAVQNLLAEGITGPSVVLTGNTVVDAVLSIAGRPMTYSDSRLAALENRVRSKQSRLMLVTVHRRESWGPPLAGILASVRDVLERHEDVEVVLPVHPNPEIRKQIMAGVSGVDRIHLTAPLNYLEFCRLLSIAQLVASDSGGVQEEAPSFGVPVLVLRDVTERMEAVEAGCSMLVGTDPLAIAHHATRLLNIPPLPPENRPVNPFGDGLAAYRTEHAIASLLGLESADSMAPPVLRTAAAGGE